MSQVVVDASVALAWCFPDKTSDYADAVLVSLERKTMLVPAVWSLEIANAALPGERRKRLRAPEIEQFNALLRSLSIVQDTRPVAHHINEVLPLARKHSLSAYDAAYLELSVRHGVPLATLDDIEESRKAGGRINFHRETLAIAFLVTLRTATLAAVPPRSASRPCGSVRKAKLQLYPSIFNSSVKSNQRFRCPRHIFPLASFSVQPRIRSMRVFTLMPSPSATHSSAPPGR